MCCFFFVFFDYLDYKIRPLHTSSVMIHAVLQIVFLCAQQSGASGSLGVLALASSHALAPSEGIKVWASRAVSLSLLNLNFPTHFDFILSTIGMEVDLEVDIDLLVCCASNRVSILKHSDF